MCELDPDALTRATQSNLRALNTSFDNVTSIFDAAIKRARAKQAKCRVQTRDDDPPPRKSA